MLHACLPLSLGVGPYLDSFDLGAFLLPPATMPRVKSMANKRPRQEEASTSHVRAATPPVAAPPPKPLGVPTALFVDRGFVVEHTVDVDTLMREDMPE